ncbi:MAG: PIN domain-containing protein [Bacteroidota bacterium]
MGLIKKFSNKTVFLDTAPLIYYIEENTQYIHVLDKLFAANDQKKFLFSTSVLTLMEILVHPIRIKSSELVKEYENILCNSKTLDIYDFTIEIAKLAAKIRADYGFKTPDSIQLATAISTQSDFFLTNDKSLKSFKEIEIIVLDDNLN